MHQEYRGNGNETYAQIETLEAEMTALKGG